MTTLLAFAYLAGALGTGFGVARASDVSDFDGAWGVAAAGFLGALAGAVWPLILALYLLGRLARLGK